MFGQRLAHNGVVYRRKILFDVTLQHIFVASGKAGAAIQGLVVAFLFPVGVAVADKPAFKNRFDNLAQGMMRDSILKWGSTYQPPFGFVDVKTFVGAGLVALVAEFRLQAQQIIFQPMFKGGDVGQAPFAPGGLPIGPSQVGPAIKFGIDGLPPVCHSREHVPGRVPRPGDEPKGGGAVVICPAHARRRGTRPGTGSAIFFCLGPEGSPPPDISGRYSLS